MQSGCIVVSVAIIGGVRNKEEVGMTNTEITLFAAFIPGVCSLAVPIVKAAIEAFKEKTPAF